MAAGYQPQRRFLELAPGERRSPGNGARSLGGYAAVPGKPNAVYVTVDPSFRIRYFTFQGGTLPTASGYETSGATVTTAPALTTSGQLYVKGFDGKIYTKTLDAAGGYSLVSGL